MRGLLFDLQALFPVVSIAEQTTDRSFPNFRIPFPVPWFSNIQLRRSRLVCTTTEKRETPPPSKKLRDQLAHRVLQITSEFDLSWLKM